MTALTAAVLGSWVFASACVISDKISTTGVIIFWCGAVAVTVWSQL